MRKKFSVAAILILAGVAGCKRSDTDDLDANIANAFSSYTANQQNESMSESILSDNPGDAAPDNTSDELNADMQEAANVSVAIGAAQGAAGEGFAGR